jgi:RND superfamily putative drug exporter
MRPTCFELSATSLDIVWPLRRLQVPLAAIARVELLSSADFRSRYGYGYRIGAGGLWGVEIADEALVTGAAADLVDTKDSLFAALPWAVGIIATVTFIVLFLMFGSLLVPAKAVVLNLLSLSAAFGSMVWIFQDGNLADLLNFTPTGALDLTMPILIFCIAFGLSMDYEVFLLSRIKEEHDKGADNVTSVAVGLERTGRIVTAAALLIAVVFIAFATSSVTMIKMFGLGMTVAVLVDAFVVRATLVPAFMRLAGDANWWAPAWMKRIYHRFGISEGVVLDAAPPTIGSEPITV